MKITAIDTLTTVDDGVTFEVESTVGALRIATGASSGSLSLTAKAWKRMGDNSRAAYSCYFAMYSRTATAFTRMAYGGKAATWTPGAKTVASTVEEVVIVISDTALSGSSYASALPSAYLAKTSVKISADGPATAVYHFVFDHFSAVYNSSTKKFNCTFECRVIKTEGSTRSEVSAGSVSSRIDQDTWSAAGISNGVFDDDQVYDNITRNTAPTSMNFKYVVGNDILATASQPVSISITGATGKMCYIAGEYREDIVYTSSSTQTVAVEVTGPGNTVELFYLVAATNVDGNGNHWPPLDANGNLNSTYWARGLNEYNLIRTKYLFAEFADLGDFVVSGSWLFSRFGKLIAPENHPRYGDPIIIGPSNYNSNYNGKPPYMWFDSNDPRGETLPASNKYKFVPTFAVDGLNGRSIQQDSVIVGNVFKPFVRLNDDTYEDFGIIEDDKFRFVLPDNVQSVQVEEMSNEDVPLDTNGYYSFELPSVTADTVGWELDIMNMSGKTISFIAASNIRTNPRTSNGGKRLLLSDNSILRLKSIQISFSNSVIYCWIRLQQSSLSF